MNDRKKLLMAILTGGSLSLLCCFAFTAWNAAGGSHPYVKSTSHDTLQTAQPVPPVVTEDAPADAIPAVEAGTAPAASRRSKPAKVARVSKPRPGSAANITQSPVLPAPDVAAVQSGPAPQDADPRGAGQAVTAEQARAALREVGTNAEAEALWTKAINDPNLPAKQRKDLIEDLNEEGFADPRHLTAADLPRIDSRLALIEEIAPQAMDQTNADAFQEAYKDLTNMRDTLSKP